ncbi:hypothetical protein B0H19DRAFT_1066532 [Mycena capillaripes]|nr:hypothetical protein B0H19DRAFT_1066532 [Mycena capillaripes]
MLRMPEDVPNCSRVYDLTPQNHYLTDSGFKIQDKFADVSSHSRSQDKTRPQDLKPKFARTSRLGDKDARRSSAVNSSSVKPSVPADGIVGHAAHVPVSAAHNYFLTGAARARGSVRCLSHLFVFTATVCCKPLPTFLHNLDLRRDLGFQGACHSLLHYK